MLLIKFYSEFLIFLQKKVSNSHKARELIIEIKNLCSDNSYINRISASSAFTSLYKSNNLDKYLSQSKKNIYLDTPLLVFFICYKYDLSHYNIEWEDPFYKTTKNLFEIWENSNKKIYLSTMFDYLKEVTGELQKALKTSYFLEFDFMDKLGETRNTFINYFLFLKRNNLIKEEINDFTDFIIDLGFENYDPESNSFQEDTLKNLKEIFQTFEIDIVFHQNYSDFEELRKEYEMTLMQREKTKSRAAISNDLRLIRFLADSELNVVKEGSYLEPFFATWDKSFYDFRKNILKKYQGKYSFFHIYNPSRLINKICLENFKVNSEIITNDIFAYAEANYRISSKVKSLIDLIAPILGPTARKNIKLVRQLGEIRSNQLVEQGDYNEGFDVNRNLPIEEVILTTINYFQSPDTEYTFEDFTDVFCDEKYTDLIVEFVNSRSKELIFDFKINKNTFSQLEQLIESKRQ